MNTDQGSKGYNAASSDAVGLNAPSDKAPDACRYRCTHVAWTGVESAAGSATQSVAAMDGQVQRVSERLRLLDQVCQRMASFRAGEMDASVAPNTVGSCWVMRVHLEMLIAVFAMQSLRLHCARQLLAQPRNHVALSCLGASHALLSAFVSSIDTCQTRSPACRNTHLIDTTMKMMRTEQQHWLGLLQSTEQGRVVRQQGINDGVMDSHHVRAVERLLVGAEAWQDLDVTHGSSLDDPIQPRQASCAVDKCQAPKCACAQEPQTCNGQGFSQPFVLAKKLHAVRAEFSI